MKATKIKEPTVCPYCGAPVERKLENGAHLYCTNPYCPEVLVEKINYFVSKECMDIDGFSEKTIRKIIDTVEINSWRDLYSLSENMLTEVCGLGPKISANIILQLRKSKIEVPPYRVLVSMGIPNIGKVVAQKLLDKYNSIDVLHTMCTNGKIDELVELIGPVATENLVNWFLTSDDIYDIYEVGLQHINPEEDKSLKPLIGNKLSGLIIMATGTLNNFTREGIKQSVIDNGGTYASGVNKKLNYLIVGSAPGESKIVKAKELGIKQISENEYMEMIV